MGGMKRQVTLQTSGVACTLKGGVGEKGKLGCARTMFFLPTIAASSHPPD